MSDDPGIVTKLDELLAAIRGYDDPRRAAAEWKQALKLLQKTDSSPVMVTNIVAGRDMVRLAALIDQLRTPEAVDTVTFFWNYLKLPKNDESVHKVAKAFSDSNLFYPPDLLPGIKPVLKNLSEKLVTTTINYVDNELTPADELTLNFNLGPQTRSLNEINQSKINRIKELIKK